MKKTNKEGKINFVDFVYKFGTLFYTKEEILECLLKEYPQLEDKKHCPNCGASMEERVYYFDIMCAVLLVKMAERVESLLVKGVPFTQANQVHISDLKTTLSVQCRTTIASKLGLIAKVKNKEGKQVHGVWCITKRGYDALRGEEVPSSVVVWRGMIEERPEGKITLSKAFLVQRESIQKSMSNNKKPKNDYRMIGDQYNESDWYDFVGNHEGEMLC